jgi:hypothetical protein
MACTWCVLAREEQLVFHPGAGDRIGGQQRVEWQLEQNAVRHDHERVDFSIRRPAGSTSMR